MRSNPLANWNFQFKNWNFPQDTTDHRPISFPFWMFQEIALDLEENQQLKMDVQLYSLEVEQYQALLQSLEMKDQTRALQLQLLEKNTVLLQEQLRAEKQLKKRPQPFIWALRI